MSRLITLKEYCQLRNIPYDIQQQDLQYYLTVQGAGAQDSVLVYLVQLEYPGAHLVEYRLNHRVYNLGTVFDLIQNSGHSVTLTVQQLRDLIPNRIATEIVGIHPQSDPVSIWDLSRRSKSSGCAQDNGDDQTD